MLQSITFWFVTNTLSTTYSKRIFSNDPSRDIQGEWQRQNTCVAVWLTFLQLMLPGMLGIYFVKTAGKFQTSQGLNSVESNTNNTKRGTFPQAFHPYVSQGLHGSFAARKLTLVALINALSLFCLNLAYVFGSVSLVQEIKMLEPIITCLLSTKLLAMQLSFPTLLSILVVIAGAKCTLWTNSEYYSSLSVCMALLSNLTMPLRNILIKMEEEESSKQNVEHFEEEVSQQIMGETDTSSSIL